MSAVAADCKEGNRQEHHPSSFNFVTSSWVEDQGNLRRYISCVGNLDAGTDLLITWYIAGPFSSYVPSDEAVYTPRLRPDLNPQPVAGCIKFGSNGEHTPAEFMGTAADQEENTRYSPCKGGQAAVHAVMGDDRLPADGYRDSVRIFFPSDPEDAYATLLELNGEIGIRPRDNAFESYFNYTLQRYKDRPDGRPEDVSIRPIFPDAYSKTLLAAYAEANPEPKLLSEKGEIAFTVASAGTGRPINAFYEILGRSGEPIAALPMPMFNPLGF
ncbi:hypothetical protein C9427_19380 [Mesorhizobium helmanticense]|uniref:Uncharacterized protein n=1 Tax=Mesorhizobium helmanticense TaxID=1776423 RepID=A0A2T4IT57_9HYPH|nr:hypothetical protein C9427_19380 [Mesorhizobium helmanticense]